MSTNVPRVKPSSGNDLTNQATTVALIKFPRRREAPQLQRGVAHGPYGRPDMALFLFTKAILESRPINVFNHGQMLRDFTYIDDIVEGVVRVLFNPEKLTKDLYNIGNNNPVELNHFISIIESYLGITAKKNFMEMQPGDVEATYADIYDLIQDVGFKPSTPIEIGVRRFLDWYLEYYPSSCR